MPRDRQPRDVGKPLRPLLAFSESCPFRLSLRMLGLFFCPTPFPLGFLSEPPLLPLFCLLGSTSLARLFLPDAVRLALLGDALFLLASMLAVLFEPFRRAALRPLMQHRTHGRFQNSFRYADLLGALRQKVAAVDLSLIGQIFRLNPDPTQLFVVTAGQRKNVCRHMSLTATPRGSGTEIAG